MTKETTFAGATTGLPDANLRIRFDDIDDKVGQLGQLFTCWRFLTEEIGRISIKDPHLRDIRNSLCGIQDVTQEKFDQLETLMRKGLSAQVITTVSNESALTESEPVNDATSTPE